MKSTRSRERGATLLVSLIMLVLLTLFAVTSFRLSKGNLQILGNMQLRNQAQSAAQQTIEQVVSSTRFVTTPADAIPYPCNAVPNTKCVDVTGRGLPDVTVAVTPSCISVKVIPVPLLSFTDPEDVGCLVGLSQQLGIAGGGSNASLCANSLWDVKAVATDAISNAQYVLNQGEAVRVAATTVCP